MSRRLTRTCTRATVVVFLLLLAAPARAQPHFQQLRIIAPAAPGGGWDQTARAMQQALQTTGLARTAMVENVPGAAGTIGLARFVGFERGKGDTLMVSGLIMLGAIVTHHSPVTLGEVTLLARLSGEYEVIAVPANSPFQTFDDLMDAFRARPEAIAWGGGSAGGSDQILTGLIAQAVGVEPRRVNYIAFSGGGESLSAILGGQVSAGVNGLAEFMPQIEAGTLRALAISSAERLPGLDVPTLREFGVDVEFENWRSVVAPPGITAEERQALEALVEAMVRSDEWQDLLQRFRWLDRYLPGKAFERFARDEEERVRGILRELGTGREAAGTFADAGAYAFFVLGGLVVFGVAAALKLPAGLPPTVPSGVRARSVGLIGLGALINVLLVEWAGFVIASAGLFWCVARAFDDRHPLRDAAYAIGLSVAAYVLFARILQLSLPAGLLGGWL
jgi:putative tricarboxylic transport membrane protein